MKTQFSAKNNNTQISDDDTTTQIQIRFNIYWAVVLIAAIIAIFVMINN